MTVASEFARLTSAFVKYPGAGATVVGEVLQGLLLTPPSDYAELLLHMNGGEGFVGEHYVRLYSVEKLQPLNQALAVAEFAPGMVIVGSNGGGEAYAFDTRDTPTRIVRIPFIPLDHTYAKTLGTTMLEVFSRLGGDLPAGREPRRAPNPDLIGKEIHEITPVIFGGDPVDPHNKAILTPEEYAPFVVWWNRTYLRARSAQGR